MEAPKLEPKLPAPFWGFTTNAEIWNSRAAMIGFFALLLLEIVRTLDPSLVPEC